MNRKSFINIFWISLASGLIFFTFFSPEKTFENFLFFVLTSAFYTLVLALGNGFVNDYLNKKYSWVEQTKLRTIYGVISLLITNVVLAYFCNYVIFVLVKGMSIEKFFSDEMNFNNWFIINVALLISAILHAKSFMEEWKKSTRKEVVEQKLIAKSANAQFESLKNQLDPHFLFNSLNVLSALIDENPNQAQRFTASMSKIYRYVLEQKDKELVTVEEEIEFAKIYCGLLKTRFEDSVSFDFKVEDSQYSFFVVPLSLQLLLENCIKHNYATPSNPLHIKIYSENGCLLIENNFQPREQMKESAGIGLSNIVQRYSLLTSENVFIEKSDDFFRVKIPILTQKIKVMNTSFDDQSQAYKRAVRRVKELKSFYANLISYCLVIPFLIFINLRTAPSYHWFWFPMLGWGIGLASHALQVFGIGKNWEDKQIQKILEKEQNHGKF